MKAKFLITAVAALSLAPSVITAQAPAGATGKCKDGTYTTAASKSGACSGHKGVDTWFGSAKSAAAAPASAKPSAPAASSSSSKVAPGGGPGLVWVNTSSNVYHCYGSKDYGTTKQGKYMSEAGAKAAGAHADHGKACPAK